MTVQFFRLIIEGTNKAKLEAIKEWVETKLEAADFSDKVVRGVGLSVSEDDINNGNYTLCLDAYIKSNVPKNKYKDIIVNEFTKLNKNGLTKAYIDKYDDCTHDEEDPQPCIVTRVLEWNA